MNRNIATSPFNSFSIVSTFMCLLMLFFFIPSAAAQIGIASFHIPKSGNKTEKKALRKGVVSSLKANKFLDDHESLGQDSVVFIALESKSTIWKKSVSVYRDSNNVVTTARVLLPNSMNAFVSLVETSTGEVIRHRAPNLKDLVAQEDFKVQAVKAVSQLEGKKLGQITVELTKDELANAPVLESSAYDSLKNWAAIALAPHVELVRSQMVKGAAEALADVVEVLVGPWKYDLSKTYAQFRSEARDGFLLDAPRGLSNESLVVAVNQRSAGIQVPSVVVRYSSLTVQDDGKLKTPMTLLTSGFGVFKLDESSSSLSDQQVFLTADLPYFYEDSANDADSPIVVSITSYSYEKTLRELTSDLAASRYVQLQIPEITNRFKELGKPLKEPDLAIGYTKRRIELKTKGQSKPYSTPVSPTSTSRIVHRLLQYMSAPTQIVQGKMKKGKLKTGLMASPIPFKLIGSNGSDVGIGNNYTNESKALINYTSRDKQSLLSSFRAFSGEEALFEAVESKTRIWLLDRIR